MTVKKKLMVQKRNSFNFTKGKEQRMFSHQ